MLNFTPLKYFFYKFLSKSPLSHKSQHIQDTIANETLSELKLRYRNHKYQEVPSKARIDAKNKSFDCSLFDILKEHGKPLYVHAQKTGSVLHQVLLYNRTIKGLKAKILYNFIDYKLATVSFQFKIFDDAQLEKVNAYVEDTFLHEKKPSCNQFYIVDELGNKVEYNYMFDVHLTFINHNPEVIQNINSALYQHNFIPSRYAHSKAFQLSI